VFCATGMTGMLVERQACCCVLCYWHGRHASGKEGMLATFCASGKTDLLYFVLVVKLTCLLHCVLLVKACKLVTQKQETRYLHGYEGGATPRKETVRRCYK